MMLGSNDKDKENNSSFGDKMINKILRSNNEFNPAIEALKIVSLYVIVGALWILLSNKVLYWLISDRKTLALIATLKGWAYILITGMIVFHLVAVTLKRIRLDQIKIDESYEGLHHIAYHDYLTNLPNRLALTDEVEKYLSSQNVKDFALLFLDVDSFKFINDTLGHDFGDQLIKSISERFSSLLLDRCSLYRLGGDEFIILINDIDKPETAETYAKEVLTSLKEPFKIGDSILHVNMSIGATLYPEHGKDVNELLCCADIAMYKAKEARGSRYMLYAPPMNEKMIERMQIEKHLHIALDHNEFELYYQPQFDLLEKRITGVEALLRWNSRELGSVSPSKFIGVAEETQLIMPLGAWVMGEACKFAKKLKEKGMEDITVAVNISILQILQDNFVEFILETLNTYQLKPSCLELEITESILMESYEVIADKLKLLNQKGVKIALDDFGKGYSSLSYLKQLPITTLKIDKSFVDCISKEDRNTSLTGQIVMIGISMGLSVIAEGVETKEQLEYLVMNNCQKVQGYLFSKPLPEHKIWQLVTSKEKCEEKAFT